MHAVDLYRDNPIVAWKWLRTTQDN